jgi:hypothetical protein
MIKNVIVTGSLLLAAAGVAAGELAFHEISAHYEAIRLALIKDSTAEIAVNAEAIGRIAADLQRSFSAAAAGVSDTDGEAVKALLPEIQDRAAELASARGLTDTRDALAELTKPLVRYHRMVDGTRPVVAYCPMEKKSWLQPDEPIGNPYDPTMLRCGEVVQR